MKKCTELKKFWGKGGFAVFRIDIRRAFGTVFLAENIMINLKVALKRIDPAEARKIRNEIDIMKSLDHKNIVKFLGAFIYKQSYWV
jgi:serine/threonine protein kinase